MNLGEVFSAQVRGLTSEGNGVVEHPSGRVVFVPGAWPDERVEVKITAIKNQFAQARIIKLIAPHHQRRAAPCPHHGFGPHQCGGCSWQFMEYSAQLAAKQDRVAQAVARFAPKAIVQPIVPAPSEFGYRSRAQLKTDGLKIGFVAAGSHQLAPINNCQILSDACQLQLQQLTAELPNPHWQKAAKRQLVTLDIDASQISVNKRLPFTQANSAQNSQMQQWLATQLAPLDRSAPVLELFAGSGNFTQVISQLGFSHILAAEVAAEAVAQLQALQLPNVAVEVADLFKPEQVSRLLKVIQAQILVLDPPRDGLKSAQEVLAKKSKLNTIFYISCDLATFSRDCTLLTRQGFKLREVQPLDQFPQTPHIELMARLERA